MISVSHPLLGTLVPVPESAVVMLHEVNAEAAALTIETKNVHLCIIAPEDSSGALTLTLESSVQHCTIEVHVADHAQLTVLTIQPTESTAKITQRSRIGIGSKLHWQNVTLSTAAEHELVSELVGHDAVCNIDWVFYARGEERQRLSARNIFLAPSGGGEITMRGVAEDHAHVRCDGLIEIGEQGGGTDTYLTEEVLMLDPTSKIDAIPGLEIRTNDVKASHSATVARVTPEDLFYFSSRGISQREARRMYVLGFLSDLTQRVSSDSDREAVLLAVAQKYSDTIS